jgi:hypothetical protein
MRYVFDTVSLRVIGNYYPNQFPSFWAKFDALVTAGEIISVREALSEIQFQAKSAPHIYRWAKQHRSIFLPPTADEAHFVAKIFAVKHFQSLISEKQRLRGSPVADPFLIASAKIRSACVVTEEEKKPNAAKIPNVCDHFGIDCINVEKFLEREGWQF